MKKKVLSMLLASVMMTFAITGCGSAASEQPAAESAVEEETEAADTAEDTEVQASDTEPVTISILSAMQIVDEGMMDEFMAANPNIKVSYEYVDSKDYAAKFAALASANELPDVIWTQAGFYCDQIDEGLLMDLSNELKGDAYEGDMSWSDTFIPTLIENFENVAKSGCGEMASYDYGIPFTMTTVAVMYDKAIYDKLGLSVPTTWDEFTANCDAIKDAGYSALSVQSNTCIDWLPRLFWDQFCRDEIEKQGLSFADGTMSFSTESVQKGMEEYKKLWDAGYFPENFITSDLETTEQLFIQGELAQVMIAPDKIQYIMDNAPDTLELATYALPGINGLSSRSLGGSSNIFAVSAATEHPQEAVQLLKYLTSRTNFETNANLKYSNSGLSGVEKGAELDQILQGYTDAAAGGFCSDIYVPTNITTDMSTAFKSDLIPNYLLGDVTLEDVSKELQSMYDEYLSSQN